MGPAAVPRFGHGGGPPESPHQPARCVPLILVGAVLGRAAAGSPLSLVSGAAAISSPLLGSCSDPSFPRVRCTPRDPSPPLQSMDLRSVLLGVRRPTEAGPRLPPSLPSSAAPPLFSHQPFFHLRGFCSVPPGMTGFFQPLSLCVCHPLCLGCSFRWRDKSSSDVSDPASRHPRHSSSFPCFMFPMAVTLVGTVAGLLVDGFAHRPSSGPVGP